MSDFNVGDKYTTNSRFMNKMFESYPVLPWEEVAELFRVYQKTKDEKVREKILLHNLRYVAKCAQDFWYLRVPFDDLFQWGVMGMMIAIERFDLSYDNKFLAYAKFWVRQSILREAIKITGSVRLPSHVWAKRGTIKVSIETLKTELGRHPTVKEICAHSGVGENHVRAYLEDDSNSAVSLDSRVNGDESSGAFHELIEDENSISSDMLLLAKETLQKLHETLRQIGFALRQLASQSAKDNRDVNIFSEYTGFGLDRDSSGPTLESLGEKYGITREAIRQIKLLVIKKLQVFDPNFPKSEDEFIALFQRIETLAEAVGDSTSISLIISEEPKDAHKIRKVRVCRRRRVLKSVETSNIESRANGNAPSFKRDSFERYKDWTPDRSPEKNVVLLLKNYVAFAYEIPEKKLESRRLAKRPSILLAQSVFIYMLREVLGAPHSTIMHIYRLKEGKDQMIYTTLEFIRLMRKQNQIDANNLDKLIQHWKKVTAKKRSE